MRKLIVLLLALSLAGLPFLATAEETPQIAYKLFSNWADNYMDQATKGKAIASGVLFGTGALCAAGSIATWAKGDEIAAAFDKPLNPDLRRNLSLGLGIGAGALFLSGIIVSTAPVRDYRAIYADVFEERDPEVREAMAASVLRYQADKGKERRITSFISGFAVPILAAGVKAVANVADGDPWHKDVLSSMADSTWWMAGSIVSLFQKTPEERLYERYLSARDALYGERH